MSHDEQKISDQSVDNNSILTGYQIHFTAMSERDSRQLTHMKDLIKEIHASDLRIAITEVGCGVPLASALTSVAGASNTLYAAESPYSREYQEELYGDTGFRAVSFEMCRVMMARWNGIIISEVNTIYVATFQLGPGKTTHGWIGVWHRALGVRFYHLSFRGTDHLRHTPSRDYYISEIGRIGVYILHELAQGRIDPELGVYRADIVLDIAGRDMRHQALTAYTSAPTDAFLLFDEHGKLQRAEDRFRACDRAVIYKGSFNPPHIAHQQIAQLAEQRYGVRPVFALSVNTFDKVGISIDELDRRIGLITAMGYPVIVWQSGMYSDNVKSFRDAFPAIPLVFVMGADTMTRMFASSFPDMRYGDLFKHVFRNAKLAVVPRSNVHSASAPSLSGYLSDYIDYIGDVPMTESSTAIRAAIERGDDPQKDLPPEVYKEMDRRGELRNNRRSHGH